MSDTTIPTDAGGTRSTSVSITLNTKSLGIDAFIKLEQTYEFVELASDIDAIMKRSEIAELLTEQALDEAKKAAEKVQAFAAANPRGHVSVHQVHPQAPVGQMAGQQAPVAGPAAVQAVANGAAFGSEWMDAPDRFDAAKRVRFLPSHVYPTDLLKQNIKAWIAGQGLNPDAFEVWDERTGPRGAEAGNPISSVANIKVSDTYRSVIPAKSHQTDRGQEKAVARAKFNNDKSLYIWWDKEFSAALEYGALNPLKVAQAAPAAFVDEPAF